MTTDAQRPRQQPQQRQREQGQKQKQKHQRTPIYQRFVKPALFALSPDFVHGATMNFLAFLGSIPGVSQGVHSAFATRHPELESTWRGISFSSPVGLSAGLDKNAQGVKIMQSVGFGFTEVGSVTARRCAGNPRPWFYRLPNTQSLVVHAGLPNIGIDGIMRRLEHLPTKWQRDFPTILSVARTNDEAASSDEAGIADFIVSVTRASASPAVQMIELNISCPNAFVGERFTDPTLFAQLLAAVAKVKPTKPIMVKMPIELSWEDTDTLIQVADRSGIVAGFTFGNLRKDRTDVALKDELPVTVEGGLSGAPTRELSTQLIAKTYQKYGDKFLLIGVGGILSARDAYEKIKAGATYVELITGLILNGPSFVEDVNSGLVKLLKKDGYAHISEAVGADVRAEHTKTNDSGNK